MDTGCVCVYLKFNVILKNTQQFSGSYNQNKPKGKVKKQTLPIQSLQKKKKRKKVPPTLTKLSSAQWL